MFRLIITHLFTSRYLLGALLILTIGGGYLGFRNWLDRRTEKKQNTEIIREGEEILGSWGQKSASSLIRFRLRRDGTFTYKMVQYPVSDTVTINGRYGISSANGHVKTSDYPRLIAVSDNGDTIINHFIAYLTPYDAAALDQGYDKMILNAGGRLDTAGLVFYRIKDIQ
ncbi:MAG: hypothetical protein J0H92_17015 [Sphingobacteriales bacterium]|nr:hypothetical protein [Sphingobacteriales bacterium]OJW34103.1 MAG: hypothetical protein BGO54_05390 [Sphingobacteriales bacterium 46-32]